MDSRLEDGNEAVNSEQENLDDLNASVRSSLSSSSLLSSCVEDSEAIAEELPLSFVARAERQLRKNITLDRDGSHAIFTKEDIERIHDTEVLKFLSRNAQLFSRYMGPQPALPVSDYPPAEAVVLPSRADAVEAQILSLQKEIETFITAVDDEGTKYKIITNVQGNLVVPLEEIGVAKDKEDDSVGEAEADENTSSKESLEAASSGSPAEFVPSRGDSLQREPISAVTGTVSRFKKGFHTKRLQLMNLRGDRGKPQQALATVSAPTATTGGEKGLQIPRRRAKQQEDSRLSWGDAAANSVRPVRALQAHEEARVEALLKEDFSSASSEKRDGVGSSNPFNFSSATLTRLAQIDNSLEIFARLRSFPSSQTSVSVAEPGMLDLGNNERSIRAGGSTSLDRGSSRTGLQASVLGNTYMRTAIQQQLLHQKLRGINNRLACHRRNMEKLPKIYEMGESLPEDMQELRPEWAKELDVTLPDDKLQEMITDACDEVTRAAEAGFPVVESPEPPLPYFQQHLRDVKERALRLLEQAEQDQLLRVPNDPSPE